MKFTTYIGNRPTGTHECRNCDVETTAGGQSYVEGWATPDQYILDGQIVDRPQRPSENHIWDWESLSWQLNENHAAYLAKKKRSELLAESDWTQMPDVSIATKEMWAAYRQALRDITAQDNYPFEIIWPRKP